MPTGSNGNLAKAVSQTIAATPAATSAIARSPARPVSQIKLAPPVQSPLASKPITTAVAPAIAAEPARQVMAVRRCPFCAEEILAAAIKCKHCREIIDPVRRAQEESRHVAEMHARQQQYASQQELSFVNPASVLEEDDNDDPFPYLMHFKMTFFTLGAWLPVWIVHYVYTRFSADSVAIRRA